MRNKLIAVTSLLMVASMILAACAPTPATPAASTPQVIIQTQVVEKTVVVTVQGQEKVVTATPLPPAAAKTFKSKDPTTAVEATIGDIVTMDPALAYDTASGEIIQNTYETLIFYKKEAAADFIPQLATEVPTKDNGGISGK